MRYEVCDANVCVCKLLLVVTRVQLIYRLIDIIGDIGLLQIYQYRHIYSPISADIKTVFFL